ncbi:MAG: hypothetical protein ACR2KP_06880, partial [Egibacteraceae bacterium]
MHPDELPAPGTDAYVEAAMDARTAHQVRTLLADHRGEPPPRLGDAFAALAAARGRGGAELAWVVDAAGFEQSELADPDTATLLELLACTISPTFVTAAEAEAVLALDHVDWHSLIVQLAGTGAGAA